MSKVRAKFVCKNSALSSTYKTPDGSVQPLISWSFVPVYGSDPAHENKQYWDATPAGSLEIGATKLPADTFEVGKEYYLDIISAE